MPRPELLRLLHACKQDLEDPAPRLVLADWLEEYGDERDRERAAFVRLEADSEKPGRPDFLQWRRRLWKDNERRWAPSRGGFWNASSHGGLVGTVADPAALLRLRPRGAWAWVTCLQIDPARGQTPDLLAAPALQSVPSLRLPGRADVLKALASSPLPLRELRFNHAEECDATAFLASPLASKLKLLLVADKGMLPATAWKGLARLPGLESLYAPSLPASFFKSARCRLHEIQISHGTLFSEVTRSDCCSELRRLTVSHKGHLAAMRTARFWPTLERLDICGRPFYATELPDAAPRLRHLGLSWTGIDAAGMRRLARSPLCAALDRLSIHPDLGPEGAGALTAMPAAPLTLDLGGQHLGDEGVSILARWPGLARCRVLDLCYNRITATGAKALAESPHAAGLVGLSLYANPIGEEGLRHLLAAPWAARLEQLDINSCHLPHSATALIQEADLPALKQLSADHEQKHRLRKALPHIACIA